MKAKVIVGAQYGSEGKGKVAAYFCDDTIDWAVRCGGPNSGHTHSPGVTLQQLPVGVISDRRCYISPGSYIDVPILLSEIEKYNPDLIIDGRAIVISQGGEDDLNESIGSTNSGVGIGVSNRVNRKNAYFAKDHPLLQQYIGYPKLSGNIIIEGTQGFGLSNIHGPWPYVTSRDTTASGFISEVGISPFDVSEVISVARTYPIRVAGNSGILKNEVSWRYVSELAGKDIKEYTTVTKKMRRVGMFDLDMYMESLRVNKPSIIVLNHVDYTRGAIPYNIDVDYVGLDRENIYKI